jgi:hypothetical protein
VPLAPHPPHRSVLAAIRDGEAAIPFSSPLTDHGALDNYAGLMVAGAWSSLVLESRWQRETNWIGWTGRIVGIGWIGVFMLSWLRLVF